MLTAQLPSEATATVRIKTLDSSLLRDEQKDLEFEEEEPANNERDAATADSQAAGSGAEIEDEAQCSGISLRAQAMKEFLLEKDSVRAIVLKHDGSSQEVAYDASSSGTRQLLGGRRPCIVGEIEELQLVVVKAMRSLGDGAAVNSHKLPGPLSLDECHGDYVLFRVDSAGKAGDVSLSEYQKYAEDHKAATEQWTADTERIKSHSPFGSEAKAAMQCLRGALETKLSESVSGGDLESAVNEAVQKTVDDAVAALESVGDPNFEASAERMNEDADLSIVGRSCLQMTDDRPWRSQLDDALESVREIAKLDGEAFAESIYATFCEINGEEPALEQLTTLFAKIRAEFANEAEEELDDESDAESESEAESATESEAESTAVAEHDALSESEVDEEWEETLDYIRNIGRMDGEVLAHNICDAFYEEHGEELSLEQLAEIWEGAQHELAAEAQELDDGDCSEVDESGDGTEAESESEVDEEWEEALSHIQRIARSDGQALAERVCDALSAENGEAPSLEQLSSVWQSIQDALSAEAEQEMGDDEMTPFAALRRSAETVGADWISRANALYFQQNGRAPTESELADTVRSFASEMAESVLAERNEFEEEATEPSDDGEWAETLDAVRRIARIDGEALAEDICDAFYNENGEELSLEQLADLWQGAQDDLAAEAQELSADEDAEYDPDNDDDAAMAEQDAAEDRHHEFDHFEEAAMWSSRTVSAKRGGGASWSLFFDEGDLSKEAARRNFERVLERFEKRNGRAPTSAESDNMKLFLSVTNGAGNESLSWWIGGEEDSAQHDDAADAEEEDSGSDDGAAEEEMVAIS